MSSFPTADWRSLLQKKPTPFDTHSPSINMQTCTQEFPFVSRCLSLPPCDFKDAQYFAYILLLLLLTDFLSKKKKLGLFFSWLYTLIVKKRQVLVLSNLLARDICSNNATFSGSRYVSNRFRLLRPN
ncbi:hypothetical protein AA313_de0208097 [Arthrobotrys entomopaga]|nr:hypothetical protein AA313_de0208097 [Arthrobotrys entomopaga]